MKYKLIGSSYAILSGEPDPGEGGILTLGFQGGEGIAAICLGGRSFPVTGKVCPIPETAFVTGPNRVSLSRSDGSTIPAEGIRLTGGLFCPEGAGTEDLIRAFDRRIDGLEKRIASLSSQFNRLSLESGLFS